MFDRQYLQGAALVLAASCCFAFQPVFGHLAYRDGTSVTSLLWLRFAVASGALWGLLALRGQLPRQFQAAPFLIGVVVSASAFSYFSALQHLSVGLTTLLFYLFPVYIFAFSLLAGWEKLAPIKCLAVGTAALGVFVSVDTQGQYSGLGLVLGLLAGACYGGYLMLSNRYLTTLPPFVSLAWVSLGGLVSFSVQLLFTPVDFPDGIQGYASGIGLGLICTLLALGLILAGTKRMGRSSDVAVLTTTEIAANFFLAWLLIDAEIRPQEIFGAVLIICAAVALILSAKPQS